MGLIHRIADDDPDDIAALDSRGADSKMADLLSDCLIDDVQARQDETVKRLTRAIADYYQRASNRA